MVLADKLKKPHLYFGAPQSANADGKDPFIHLKKKAVLFGSLFFMRGLKSHIALFFYPRRDIDVSAIYSHGDCTRMIGAPNLYPHLAKALHNFWRRMPELIVYSARYGHNAGIDTREKLGC